MEWYVAQQLQLRTGLNMLGSRERRRSDSWSPDTGIFKGTMDGSHEILLARALGRNAGPQCASSPPQKLGSGVPGVVLPEGSLASAPGCDRVLRRFGTSITPQHLASVPRPQVWGPDPGPQAFVLTTQVRWACLETQMWFMQSVAHNCREGHEQLCALWDATCNGECVIGD